MRRLDKKGMSAVTHDEDDSTTLDIIDDSITKKEKKLVEKKRKHDVKKALRQPKPAVKQVVKRCWAWAAIKASTQTSIELKPEQKQKRGPEPKLSRSWTETETKLNRSWTEAE